METRISVVSNPIWIIERRRPKTAWAVCAIPDHEHRLILYPRTDASRHSLVQTQLKVRCDVEAVSNVAAALQMEGLISASDRLNNSSIKKLASNLGQGACNLPPIVMAALVGHSHMNAKDKRVAESKDKRPFSL